MKIVNNIEPNIFREYDLRGIYNTDLNENVAYTIGKSFGTYMQMKGYTKTVIGHDNRESSPILSNGLITGILETGMDVIDLGLVTTPMYYFAKQHLKINNGIMITASHNPREYNGFKMSFSEIGNAYGKLIKDFRDFTNKCEFKNGKGNLSNFNIKDAYIEMITSSLDLGNKKIKAVIDCGNGTGSIIIKDIFDKLGIEYYALYCESDGAFPNHHPDPAIRENMLELLKKVVELGYDIGIGIDGDADRVGLILENGKYVSADMYMLIMYRYLSKTMKKKKALFDVKCSKTLLDELDKLGIEKIMYRTGNSYSNMKGNQEQLDFWGEFSGHVFFRDKFLGFDDGIYGGLRMIEVLSNTDKTLSELLEGINKYYSTDEIKIETTDIKKFEIVEKVKEYCIDNSYNFNDIDGIRIEFDDSWALVRASNTGPNLTMRFEAKTKDRLEEIQNEFLNLINNLK